MTRDGYWELAKVDTDGFDVQKGDQGGWLDEVGCLVCVRLASSYRLFSDVDGRKHECVNANGQRHAHNREYCRELGVFAIARCGLQDKK